MRNIQQPISKVQIDAQDEPLSIKAFNSDSGHWEYMQLRARRDWIGGRGYVYSYRRVDAPDKGISARAYENGIKAGLIKVLTDVTARVLWLSRPTAA